MNNDSFGILISQPGTSVTNATPSQILMNTNNPFFMLDTQNPAAFKNISLIITTDPPEPSGAGNTYTVVGSYKHNYTYTPSVESLFYVTAPPPGTNFCQTYFQDSGQIAAQTIADGAFLYCIADKTYVYFIVNKYNAGGGSANLLTGTNVTIGVHVFVQDVGVS
jgi:hypothetical protein